LTLLRKSEHERRLIVNQQLKACAGLKVFSCTNVGPASQLLQEYIKCEETLRWFFNAELKTHSGVVAAYNTSLDHLIKKAHRQYSLKYGNPPAQLLLDVFTNLVLRMKGDHVEIEFRMKGPADTIAELYGHNGPKGFLVYYCKQQPIAKDVVLQVLASIGAELVTHPELVEHTNNANN
jgi:hypothetical protein